jgi:hypothetical protein
VPLASPLLLIVAMSVANSFIATIMTVKQCSWSPTLRKVARLPLLCRVWMLDSGSIQVAAAAGRRFGTTSAKRIRIALYRAMLDVYGLIIAEEGRGLSLLASDNAR